MNFDNLVLKNKKGNKNMEEEDFRVCSGSTIGYEHVRLIRNNQDGMETGRVKVGSKTYIFGVVCDGSNWKN
jgi:hypothetical protein